MKGPMKEFGLIRQIQRETSGPDHGVILGIGDDAAILDVPEGQHLVAATDMLNAGIHFPVDTSPSDIGYKCLAVNLSDLAAMGATPKWALLSLSLPAADPLWMKSFTAGFRALAQTYDVALVGGDTTHGPLSISVTALGVVEPERQMLRSGARAGDLVVVSGTIGGAARILELIQAGEDHAERHLLDRPSPRISLGKALSGYASACIDVSDGLLADLGHILTASRVAARIEVSRLPASAVLFDLEEEQRWNYQLAGGDDYELLFTLPEHHRPLLDDWSTKLSIRLSVIGQVEEGEGEGIRCVASGGKIFNPRRPRFDHFKPSS